MSDLRSHLDALFADGPISFERFMESALYDPAFGYYTANIETVGGRTADFATSATLSKQLGRAIANWIQQQFDECHITTVIEIGGGDGSLAREVLRGMGFFLRRKIRYRIVEISPVLRKQQQQVIGRKAEWFSTIEDAVADLDSAILFPNELVDAFPVRWLRWQNQWEEIFVDFNRETGLSEQFRPIEDLEIRDLPEQSGQRIEVHDSYRRWISEWMPKLQAASVLTIDYGGSPEEMYARRPGGTLRGYFRHQRIEGGDIYRRFGKQDLTADVNFEAIKRWGAEFDFQPTAYETQGEFLERMGISTTDLELGEANVAFRVLEQVKRPK